MPEDNTSRFDRRTFLKASGAAGAAVSLGGLTAATPGRRPGPKETEVLVGVSASAPDIESAVAKHTPMGAKVVHKNESLGYVAIDFPDLTADRARQSFIESIQKKPHVKYAEPNATFETQLTPNDPQFSSQYAPQQIGADDAWDTTLGSSGCTIAVIDTGVQYDHADLSAQFGSDKGQDFADGDGDPYPDDTSSEYHGTHVAGIAAGTTNNGTGIAGISNSTLLSGRALDEGGSGSTADIADAVEWAADQGADVINMSLGGGGYNQTMKNAVSYAHGQGVTIVCAAGNDYGSSVSYPAAYEECIAVSAVDSNENLASFSNVGPEIELAAPGVDVLSTTTDARGSYEQLSGTSMASPVVAGVAGLVCAQWGLSNSETRRHLKATASDIGLSSDEQGCGQVDAAAAVNTDPSGSGECGDGGEDPPGGSCGDRSSSQSVSGSLSGSSDYECWSWNWDFSSPCEVVVTLDGPSNADFDLYVSEGSSYCPSPWSYDHRSISPNSQEQIVISNPDTSTPLQIDVESYSGSGSYTLEITESST